MSEIPLDTFQEMRKIQSFLFLWLEMEQKNENRPIVLNFLHELIEKAQALTADLESPSGPEIVDNSPGWAETARRGLLETPCD